MLLSSQGILITSIHASRTILHMRFCVTPATFMLSPPLRSISFVCISEVGTYLHNQHARTHGRLLEAFACVNASSKAFGFGVGGMDGQEDDYSGMCNLTFRVYRQADDYSGVCNFTFRVDRQADDYSGICNLTFRLDSQADDYSGLCNLTLRVDRQGDDYTGIVNLTFRVGGQEDDYSGMCN